MRITMTEEEFEAVFKAVLKEDTQLANLLVERKEEFYNSITTLKRNATKKAQEVRQKEVKSKIENAVNLLRIEGAKITEYAVSKKSGCSINTVKKYRAFIEAQKPHKPLDHA